MSGALVEIGGRPIDAGNSAARWTERRGWRIEIDGGIGEASPLPGVSRETHAAVGVALSRYLEDRRAPLPPSARFAVETAELDAAARRSGRSIAEVLGAAPKAAASGSELGPDPSPACRCAKLKVGPAAAWPEQRRAIDALVASRRDLRIRLDFNGSLTADEAGRIAAEIAAAGWPLDFVEDPTPFAELRPLPVPIAVDAVIATRGGVDRAIGSPASIAVLKPALLGGLRRALDLAATFAAAGMTPIASHLLDGPIALAACAELACAIGGELAHGVGLHPGLASYEPAVIAQLDGPWLRARAGGLGATTDADADADAGKGSW